MLFNSRRNQLMSPQERNIVFHGLFKAAPPHQRKRTQESESTNTTHSPNGLKSICAADTPRFLSIILCRSAFSNVTIPQSTPSPLALETPCWPASHNIPVCFTRKIAFVPSSCCEMISDRRLSDAFPPALRMTCASPRGIPNALDVSIRASMHVTGTLAGQLLG